ncbi:putative aspartate and glycine-rich protein-like [Capsicum annuum]|nr:putative aspartate and glycine-rich protein-like [Capsicum annuum]
MVNGASYKLVVGNTGTGYYKETQKYDHYIDLKHVPELLIIKRDQAGIEVGATVTISKFILFLKEESKINFGSHGKLVSENWLTTWRNCFAISAPRPHGNALAYVNATFQADVSHCKKGVLIGNIHLAFGAYGTKHATKAKKVEEFLAGKMLTVDVLYEALKLVKLLVVPEDGTLHPEYRSSLVVLLFLSFFIQIKLLVCFPLLYIPAFLLYSVLYSLWLQYLCYVICFCAVLCVCLISLTGVHSSISGGLLDGTNYISDEEVTESGNNGCVTPGRKQTLLSSAKQVVEFSTEYHPVGEPMKKVWDYLKTEYEGDERIRGMQVLNLVREFELQRIKLSETIKEYSDRLFNLANRIRLLGSTFNDSRIVEKILITAFERFEATITTLENTKYLSKIILAELLSAFQAQEQRRVMRQGGVVEGTLPAKHHDDGRSKKKKKKKKYQPTDEEGAAHNNRNKIGGFKGNYPPCKHCGKLGHAPFKCWKKPDAKCTKCNQIGHEAIICKNKTQQQDEEAQVVNKQEEDQLFVASYFTSSISSES